MENNNIENIEILREKYNNILDILNYIKELDTDYNVSVSSSIEAEDERDGILNIIKYDRNFLIISICLIVLFEVLSFFLPGIVTDNAFNIVNIISKITTISLGTAGLASSILLVKNLYIEKEYDKVFNIALQEQMEIENSKEIEEQNLENKIYELNEYIDKILKVDKENDEDITNVNKFINDGLDKDSPKFSYPLIPEALTDTIYKDTHILGGRKK